MSRRFDPAKAARLDDPARLAYLPLARVWALLDAPRGSVVLDYGAGTGFFALALAAERPDLTIVAYDRQPDMLALLRAKPAFGAAAGRVVTAGVKDELDPYAGRVSRILCVNALHELDDADLDDMRRLLAPEGAGLVIDWDASVPREIGPHGPHVFDGPGAHAYLITRGYTPEPPVRERYQYAIRFRSERAP